MKQRIFLLLIYIYCIGLPTHAQSDIKVSHQNDFSNGIPSDYSTYDLDGQTHHFTMVQEGIDQGYAWICLRESGSSNRFAASTSKYKATAGSEVMPANDWLITGRIRIYAADARLTWRGQSICNDINVGDTYEIRVSTTGNHPDDFTSSPLATIEEETVNSWSEHEVSLGAYAGQDVYVAFVNRSTAKEILAIDNICVSGSGGAFDIVSGLSEHTYGESPVSISGWLHSNATTTLDDFVAFCEVEGKEYRREYNGIGLQPGEKFAFKFDETFPITPGDTLRYKLWTEIEGERPDTLKAYTVGFLFDPQRRTVIEEGTGMWCGWCPLGIISMERLKEKYPDTFIGIAVHYDDILEVEGYAREMRFSAYPSGWFNRKHEVMPIVEADKNGDVDYTQSLAVFEKYFLAEQNEETLADVSLTASFEEQTVTVNTQTRFAVNIANASYKLALVVVEDQMQGSNFYQTNYLNGITGYDLDGFESQPYTIVPYTFNDVALSIAGHRTGIPHSVPQEIKAGETYNFEHSFSVSNIQNPENARVVALLIDEKTGHVINAAQTSLATTGIASAISNEALSFMVDEENQSIRYHQASDSGMLTLTGMDGRIIHKVSTKKGTGILPLPHLSAGVYVVNMQTENATKSMKIAIK